MLTNSLSWFPLEEPLQFKVLKVLQHFLSTHFVCRSSHGSFWRNPYSKKYPIFPTNVDHLRYRWAARGPCGWDRRSWASQSFVVSAKTSSQEMPARNGSEPLAPRRANEDTRELAHRKEAADDSRFSSSQVGVWSQKAPHHISEPVAPQVKPNQNKQTLQECSLQDWFHPSQQEQRICVCCFHVQ